MTQYKSKLVRAILFTTGVISLILGFFGIFLPILPTTPFVLLSAWCFLKSSTKAHAWLYQQKYIGDSLRQWEKNKSISRKTKITAISMILISMLVMWTKVDIFPLKLFVTILLLTVSVFISTRPEN